MIATDSRGVFGDTPLMREHEEKLNLVNGRFCVAQLGYVAGADKVIEDIRSKCGETRVESTRDFIELCEDAMFEYTKKYGERMKASEEDLDFSLMIVSADGIYSVFLDGMSDNFGEYACSGSSELYGEYVLKQLYKEKAELSVGAQWAAYAITQASHLDPSVGGPVQIAYVTKEGVKVLTSDEVAKIEQQISGQSLEFQRNLFDTLDRIISLRREINQLMMKSHKFSPFSQREAEMWALSRPVVTEEDFTNRALALGVLIDEMTYSNGVSKSSTSKLGSIAELERWLEAQTVDKAKVKTALKSLREIRTLRNKSFPVHPDDSEFVKVVVGWGLTFPPDWARLYLMALEKYSAALFELKSLVS